MSSAAQGLVAKFGNQVSLAEALGVRQPTVAHWVKTGNIPAKWHTKILEAAASRGLSLSAGEMVNAPEANVPVSPSAFLSADMTLGDEDDNLSISCYVLNDGRRVISRTSALGALAGAQDLTLGGDLRRYVKPVEAYLRVNLDDELLEFKLDNVSNKRVFGISADCFLEICRAFIRARDAGENLTTRQLEIARNAGAFLAACANVGLTALIDEATGYQYMRSEDALRVKLRAYLEAEMRTWEKTFPDELWVEFGRLTGWKGSVQNRPKYWGHLVNELVYEYLDPDVFAWLKENNPQPRHGRNYHQWLSSQYGLKRLVEHIWMLIGMASACQTMAELKQRMAAKFGKEPVQLWMFLDPPNANPDRETDL